MTGTAISRLGQARGELVRQTPAGVRLALKVVLVAIVCHLAIQVGHLTKLPPHDISALWPASAVLVSVLVAAPLRHWWAYLLGGYATYALDVAHGGFLPSDALYQLADIVKVLIAAAGVRGFADGLRAFESLPSLARYVACAVLLAPATSAFVAAAAGGPGYWFYWRAWFFSEALAFLVLAPALLAWLHAVRTRTGRVPLARLAEAGLLAAGLIAISFAVFTRAPGHALAVPALVYLPMPFLLWAAVRFGPAGVNSALLVVAFLAISGVVRREGPFAAGAPSDNVLPLQFFLITLSLPLMCLAALVAERRQRANALRESEERFRSMADTAPVFIWLSGPDKLCTFLNKVWLDFTGRAFDEEAGDGWANSIHADDRERCIAAYAAAFDARRAFTLEYRLRRHDGVYRWVMAKGVPRTTPEGTFVGFIGCAEDVSARREAELASQQHRAELAHVARLSTLGELAASLAHELNQPLAAILGNAETAVKMLGRDRVDLPELRAICGDIVSENQRAAAVMRRMRALVRKQAPVLVPLHIGGVIGDVARLVHADALQRQCRVQLEIAPGLPQVRGDRIELQQVVLNLLLNAFDAMSGRAASERRVEVRASLDEALGVMVAVRDCGTGVAAGDLERIFAPFHTTKGGGLGMGLPICRTIIAAHDGRLWAQNNPQRGASFFFSLPAAGASPPEASVTGSAPP